MIRLANIMAGAPQGGAEAFYERLTLALHRAGEEVLPVIRRDPGRAARLADARPVELRFGGALDILTPMRLNRILGDWRPRVAMAWMNRAAGMTPRGDWTLVGRLGGYYDLKYYRHCDHLVGNTRDLRRWIIAQGWPEARVHFLPNFATDFAGVAPASGVQLLAMGRLHANKGFDTLIRALALVPGAHLSIAGEGPERAALERLAQECGVAERVALLGWREDTGALLAGCDLFLCPSRHEPLGNVVLEAWSAARPVIAAAAQGPSELITDGETGLLVPVDAPEALAGAIRALLAEPGRAAALAAAGRAAFERDFAEATVLAQWRDFLHKVQR
ncbi:glycosyltransferase [Sediminicoccus rosea]|jgi:glycosyltransferase involved in cell wall biosynthesis|uniref:Glycosyltransferase n=1 Tax=Sediminicoccus rosea TaxID=1225128 RepID=A0ABZ0PHA7_9PROT|nr:glycosyltransferase [Sediminicoccus rosea]WPB84520.1 glycosyltransferase [Sediminicoccus rosea]